MTDTITRAIPFGPSSRLINVGDMVEVFSEEPLKLDGGAALGNIPVAYRTYGELNADKSNAILIFHGLTGDQYMLDTHPVTDKPGWWHHMAGDGKPLDTKKYFLIVPNCLGGCVGTLGPKDNNPETGKPYALDFPVFTIADQVRVQHELVEVLGIKRLYAIMGGSMGGMQALSYANLYPDGAQKVIVLASAARHTTQNIAFHEIGRQAIMADVGWDGGRYLTKKTYPEKGLAVARMTAHVTYLSEDGLARKFGRNLQDKEDLSYGFEADFQVESYLRHQGSTFVERFDPNSYLYITRAMDYFDLIADYQGNLANAYKESKASFCIVSFSSDWLFPTSEAKQVVHALYATGNPVSFTEIETDKGHDAFLLDEPALRDVVSGFLG